MSFAVNDTMKRIYKKVFKSKKPSLASIHGPATSTSADLMPSIPASASEGTASAQVTTGVSVSVQRNPSYL